jgi:cold shock CspA family protein
VATGRVLQFDQARGFGFITAEDGEDDVFLHASVFDGSPSELTPGTKVKFEVMAGDRGRKAFAVRLVEDESPAPEQSVPQPLAASDEEQMCDVLSKAEFRQEITELLLGASPTLTGQQILQVRQTMVEFAGKHGWIDV